jgi:prophage regulatory protein
MLGAFARKENLMSDIRVLRLPTVKSKTGLSRSSIYEYMASGRFPMPTQLTTRSVGWIEAEVNDWIESRIVASRQPSTAA